MSDTDGVTVSQEAPEPVGAYPHARRAGGLLFLSGIVATIVLTSVLFSLGGLINGIFARSFDDTSIIPTFVLTPLTYLGGVFYSIELLPPVWRSVSLANPALYMVDAFRYGILGVSDVPIALAFAVITGCIAVLWCWSLYLLNRGVGIRS